MGQGGTHPLYRDSRGLTMFPIASVQIGDEVAENIDVPASATYRLEPLGTVTDIHGETFGDGPGDTITVIPAAVTLSTGDRYPVADLVLLRRAEQ